MPHKNQPIKVLLEFIPPTGASFPEIRDFIITELESSGGSRHPSDPLFHSLADVKVSKPIAAWRDPTRKPKSKLIEIKANS